MKPVAPAQRLNRRLALHIIFFSSVVAIATTVVQLWTDYRLEIEQLTDQQSYIADSYLETLQSSVWTLSEDLVVKQIDGIAKLPGITAVQVQTLHGKSWEAGQRQEEQVIERRLPLRQRYLNQNELEIGVLTIQSDLRPVYRGLALRAARMLLFNGIKTFLVALFILMLVKRLVTNRLARIAAHLASGQPRQALQVHRPAPGQADEIDELAEALAESQRRLAQALTDRERLLIVETGFKQELERQVAERTRELLHLLDELRYAQDLLVDRERLASLGGMVAGMAHEINTPLGIGLSVASSLDHQCRDLRQQVLDGSLRKSTFQRFIANMEEGSGLILGSLTRAADLMGSFKRYAVDQSASQRRSFDMADTLGEVCASLAPLLRDGQHELQLRCPSGIALDSYPGALGQVITNLVTNSLVHGFEQQSRGCIRLEVREQAGNPLVSLRYSDDGRGMDESVRRRIFDPFFTTRMGIGGSGLGMHIVHTIVKGLLGGSVEVASSPGQGATVSLLIPRSAPADTGQPATQL